MKLAFACALVAAAVLLSGCIAEPATSNIAPTEIRTFVDTGADVCAENGKPVIRLFGTTTCPHCKWISNAFDSTAREYAGAGRIVARHWQLDTGDDTLSTGAERAVPAAELEVYQNYNPRNTVPTFVFGCKYLRIGNGYEQENNLDAEVGEFKAVFEALLKETAG